MYCWDVDGAGFVTYSRFNNLLPLIDKSIRVKIPKLKIHKKSYTMLNGKKRILVARVNDGSIIKRFDKRRKKENSNWGKKIDFTTRLKIYKELLDYLKNDLDYTDVTLCKETVAMWKKLKMIWHKIKCNCVW